MWRVTMRQERARYELEAERIRCYSELHRSMTDIDVHSLERICRRIHIVELKLYSFKGGVYDKE